MREMEADSTEAASSDKDDKGDKRKEVVFVVKDGVAKMIEVETGISDDANIEIISGIEEGDKVVSGSYKAISRDLKNDDQVKVKQSGSEEEEKSE